MLFSITTIHLKARQRHQKRAPLIFRHPLPPPPQTRSPSARRPTPRRRTRGPRATPASRCTSSRAAWCSWAANSTRTTCTASRSARATRSTRVSWTSRCAAARAAPSTPLTLSKPSCHRPHPHPHPRLYPPQLLIRSKAKAPADNRLMLWWPPGHRLKQKSSRWAPFDNAARASLSPYATCPKYSSRGSFSLARTNESLRVSKLIIFRHFVWLFIICVCLTINWVAYYYKQKKKLNCWFLLINKWNVQVLWLIFSSKLKIYILIAQYEYF